MSTLLEQASLIMIPSGYKEDVVYSVIPENGNGDLSFTRASNGTRINSAGLVEVVPWNLLLDTDTFSSWNLEGGTLTSGFTDPNGGSTAYKYVQTTGGLYSGGVATADVKFAQVWIKSVSGGAITCNISDGSAFFGTFNVTGTWQLFTAPYTANTRNGVYLYAISNASGIYVWHPQLNIGSTAKPYFPTTDRLNVPRLTYQNGGGGCPSLLLEKQSTNLVTYSEQFDNAVWTKNVSVTANAITSPDGTQNADKILESASNVQQWAYQSFVMVGAQTATIYAKKGERNYIALATGGLDFSYFNLDTGVVVSTASGATTSIQSVGNGWYRCSVIVSSATSIYFIVCISDDGVRFSYAGDSSKGVYVWGAQNEASSYPTSYIPTTSASATRVADACFKTGISSLIGTDFTVFLDCYQSVGGSGSRYLVLKGSGGTYANSVFLESNASRQIACSVINSASSLVFGPLSGSYSSGQRLKIAVRCKNNDFAFYINGSLISSQASGSVPTTADLYVGYYVDYTDNYNLINQVAIFNQTLTNAELSALTTI